LNRKAKGSVPLEENVDSRPNAARKTVFGTFSASPGVIEKENGSKWDGKQGKTNDFVKIAASFTTGTTKGFPYETA
jgi:hypothetical protein